MYCHTHNSLVLYFHEKSEAGSGGSRRSVQDMYVFYDHATEMFGIRGYAFPSGTIPRGAEANIYALECASRKVLKDFIKKVFGEYRFLQVSLVNYNDLPLRSEDITYEWLSSENQVHREIVGHDYRGPSVGEVSVYNFEDAPKMLAMLKHVYQEY